MLHSKQSFQARHPVNWATEELLNLAEAIVGCLPGNIQTKYFMVKAELLRRAAIVGANYDGKHNTSDNLQAKSDNQHTKQYQLTTVQADKREEREEKLIQNPTYDQETTKQEQNNTVQAPNNTRMTVDELKSDNQYKNNNPGQQEQNQTRNANISPQKSEQNIQNCLQEQKQAHKDEKHQNALKLQDQNNELTSIVPLKNTTEYIHPKVIMQDVEVQTDTIPVKKSKDEKKAYENQIQQLKDDIKRLQDQLEVERMKNQEFVKVVSNRTKDVADAENKITQLNKNQKTIKEVLAGLISKIGGGDNLGSAVLKDKSLSELLDMLNSQINVFCGFIYETQEKLKAQVTEHNATVSTLENKVKELQQAVIIAEETNQNIKADATRCIREIAMRADQHVSAVQTRLADLFRDFQKAKHAHGFRESVSRMFEVSSGESKDHSVISRSVRSSQ